MSRPRGGFMPDSSGKDSGCHRDLSLRAPGRLAASVLMLFVGIVSPTFAQKSKTKVAPPAKTQAGPTTPATPTGGSKSTFTITVDQQYCDISLPYSYSSTRQNLRLNVQSTGNWDSILQESWNNYPQLAKSAGPAAVPTNQTLNAKIQMSFTALPPPQPMSFGGADDPPILDDEKPPRPQIDDEGDTLLGDPTQELHVNTFDVQRLLVRTLFGPNPFQLACAYPYLKYPNPAEANVTTEQLKIGADGNQIELLGKGSGYPFSLNDAKSPQYFLIDIVRWRDAPAPGGGPSIPYFQPVSDDWYLLNYSDWKERPQDISKWFHAITPALADSTLRIVGSSQVMFLAIHLAPMVTLDPTIEQPTTVRGKPTEQAWYDDVTIKYSIQASVYEPTQMQDLNDLVQILATYIGAAPAAAAANAAPAAPVPPRPPPPAPPFSVLDAFLRQSKSPGAPIRISTYQGRYAAGLLTNLTALPVNLTNTWTATFTASNQNVNGQATAYDTRSAAEIQKAAASADPSTPPVSSSPPCSVALDSTNKTTQADCNVTGAKVQNEGLAHWDISVVVPTSGYSDVTFASSTTPGGTNSITAKTVSRTNAYAVFDLFLYPEDLVRPPNVGLPHVVVGLPFAGQVFDKPYFAVGETFNLPNTLGKLKIFDWFPGVSSQVSSDLPLSIRPTFGWVYNKVFPKPGTSASYRSLKPQYGVEISITGLVKTLSKTNSSSSTKSTNTPSTVPASSGS
jgi:hypothetical protein